MAEASFIFKATDLARRNRAYTFDDLLLVPCRSSVQSRSDVNIETQLTKRFQLKLPLVAANMDTISESEMCIAMNEIGATAILHRFMSIEEQVGQLKKIREKYKAGFGSLAASVGVSQDSRERAKALVQAGAEILTIDIAHGHSEAMLETLSYIKKNFSEVDVIAGNVATPRAAEDLIRAGADALKVGIGPGSMCTTRIITGVGMPQLSAIGVCAEIGRREGVPVIADGGIRTSGDAMKALCAGASTVMLGNVLAGSLETPGELINGKKVYRGMASRMAQTEWRGGQLPEGMAPEGESHFVNCKGPVREIVHEFAGGIRSGMSYLNSRRLADLTEFAHFVEVSANCLRENTAHGLLK
jgi:IMP dehydrogenase